MKPGDLVEWKGLDGKYNKRGIIIRKSNIFGWLIYFPTSHKKIGHHGESTIKKIQQLTEEK